MYYKNISYFYYPVKYVRLISSTDIFSPQHSSILLDSAFGLSKTFLNIFF